MRKLNLKDECGQTMILALLSMTVLLGMVGFAVDVGLMFRAKRNLQVAADSAAVAAASELNYGDWSAAGQAGAAQNGVTNGSNGATVVINSPPVYGPHAGLSGYAEAIVSQSQPTFFMRLFNRSAMTVSSRAVATLVANNQCIDTLGASGTDILLNGTANLTAATCAITDDSNSRQALVANGNVTLDAASIGVVGDVLSNGGNNITPTPVTGIAPASDPLAFLSPPANPGGCTSATLNGNGSYAPLTSGCYSRITINGNGSATMNPGTYYMTGPLTVNGSPTLNGTSVTIYLADSSATFTDNGNTTLNLTATTSGTYNGILFYQDPSDTNQLTLNGSSNSNLQGIVYAPDADVTMNGSGSANFYTAFVVKSLRINGNGTLNDYAVKNANSPLASGRLVE